MVSEIQLATHAVLGSSDSSQAMPFPHTMLEKRKEPRCPAHGEAEILKDGSPLFSGRLLNITPSGCFVRTAEPIQLNPCTNVEILLVVNGKVLTLAAETRFSSPKAGIGFRFLEADRAIQEILDTAISRA